MIQTIKSNKIGSLNESSLHLQLKTLYAGTNGLVEQKLNGFFIDVVKDDELIEIQTKNFSQIKEKLSILLENGYSIRLVYPLIRNKNLILVKSDSNLIKRRSPKTNNLFFIFNELIYITDLLKHKNFIFEVLMVSVNEYRILKRKNNKKSGFTTIDRNLLTIEKKFSFKTPQDFLFMLPYTLEQNFSTKDVMKTLELNYSLASKVCYVFAKLELIKVSGKIGNTKLYNYLIH